MRIKACSFALVGALFGFVACGGNPFGSSDEDDPSPGGASGVAGKASGAEAGEGTGTPTPAGGSPADGEGGLGGGGTGGTSTPEGEGAAAAGGSDDGAAGEGPAEPVFTVSKLVDDMEDGNSTLLETNGDWFVFVDKTAGTISPAKGEPFKMTALQPAREASQKAAAVTVSGFTGWGAAFGFDFSYAMGVRQAIDLGPALAVRFWAKASKSTSVRLQIPNADTDSLGGKCSGTADNACNAHFTKSFSVGTAWKQKTIQLSELKQDLPGRRAPSFDKAHVYSTFFVIGPSESVTVWVDDVELVH